MRFKVVIVGEADVGKTCIAQRASVGEFPERAKATVGAANCCIEVEVNGELISLNIWDTAGQERYRSLTQMYFTGASIAIAVFDITNLNSFKALPEFITMLKEKAGNGVKIILVGNKCDLTDRQIDIETAKEYQKEINASLYLETSAKTGAKINDLFRAVAEIAYSSIEKVQVDVIPPKKKKEGSSCC
ncbi:small GTP-binding protein, putative [Trichomonas vaginalis G3]|uniref:Small GTP-binding protein, putative n=1 Tax=Trichomonas vaginalis (strain ATCC PRA-98 / G3) TaxID=412133 RepID=A2D8H5_TRIV3|nr:GTPase protein [Trichomonas vaginalis G3]EAY23224.1 small GTP-binding protein, putative [Trichomonas vaginalis G3]KAI5534127.1 GTPase protein [Trichomonas vaginalis G3]|eukprot:XP_001584210.1 small GTP-binding protein [Trichomonas vaginalis G3]